MKFRDVDYDTWKNQYEPEFIEFLEDYDFPLDIANPVLRLDKEVKLKAIAEIAYLGWCKAKGNRLP